MPCLQPARSVGMEPFASRRVLENAVVWRLLSLQLAIPVVIAAVSAPLTR